MFARRMPGLESTDAHPDFSARIPSLPVARGLLMQPAQLLALLARGEPISGTGLAQRTGVTRAAI